MGVRIKVLLDPTSRPSYHGAHPQLFSAILRQSLQRHKPFLIHAIQFHQYQSIWSAADPAFPSDNQQLFKRH